jgi:NAD(P)-dependent dehydrogenase (short-subunit alcohol dehydrogenase family)
MMHPTVLVTGAAKRVGQVLCEHFALQGWNVVLHYNESEKEALALAGKFSEDYPDQKFCVVQGDMALGEVTAKKMMSVLPEGVTQLNALINNASVFDPGALAKTEGELLRREFVINFETPFFLMRDFYLKYKTGVIVNILDTRVHNEDSSYAAYSLAKKSLMHLTRMAALEWAPDMRVNGVAPGPVLPPLGKDDSWLSNVVAQTPLKRAVGLDNLVNSVYFLISNNSITGQIINCDSGAHLI